VIFWAHHSPHQKGISFDSAVLVGLTIVTETDRQTTPLRLYHYAASTYVVCRLKSTGFWGLGKRLSCGKMAGPILTSYTSYNVFLHKELPFVAGNDSICNKIFSGVIFFNRD